MMGKKGKTPSLIGGGAGACKFVTAIRERTCKRCKKPIPVGTDCVEVNVPTTMGHKCYCIDCFRDVLEQTKDDLDDLMEEVDGLLN
jgi:hypothetical protein